MKDLISVISRMTNAQFETNAILNKQVNNHTTLAMKLSESCEENRHLIDALEARVEALEVKLSPATP
jgi:hypothetical protein